MSVNHGRNAHRMRSTDIASITAVNGIITDFGEDSSGGFYMSFQFNSGGCGGSANSCVQVVLNDPIPWTTVSYESYNTGGASCWDFNASGSFGLGNLLAFNSSIDRVFNCVNSFNLPQFSGSNIVMSRCDNTSSNFMHGTYMVGTFRTFFVTRRRNLSTTACNINFERSCNTTGSGAQVLLRNIFVY